MPTPPDLVEVYSDKSGANECAVEQRSSGFAASVKIVKRTVRAFGGVQSVWVVCTWYTDQARAL